MYELTDFQSYQDYFRSITTGLVALGADAFIFGDDDVAANQAKVWKGKKLWLEPYQPYTITDQRSDNYLKKKKGSLWIGGAAPQKFSERYDWYKECELLVEQIIARMLQDRYEEKLVTQLTSYKVGMGEFTFSATNMLGARFDFEFDDSTGFTINESMWTP